jgi:hypothetical protein
MSSTGIPVNSVCPPPALRQPAADDLLGDPHAEMKAVDVGGVEEVDPLLQRLIHDREAVGLARLGAKVHRPQAQPTDLQAGAAERCVLHAAPAFLLASCWQRAVPALVPLLARRTPGAVRPPVCTPASTMVRAQASAVV